MVRKTMGNATIRFLLVALVAAGASSGCYESLDVKNIKCSNNEGCPDGYMCCSGGCVKKGGVCPPHDGGGDDRVSSFDGSSEVHEVQVSFDVGKMEARADGSTETQAFEGDTNGATLSDDASVSLDGGESPTDVSLPEGDGAAVDTPVPTPDTRAGPSLDTGRNADTSTDDAADAGVVDAPVMIVPDAAGGSGGGNTGTGGMAGSGGAGGISSAGNGGSTDTGGAGNTDTGGATGGGPDTGGTPGSGGALNTAGTPSGGVDAGGGAGAGGGGAGGAGGTGGVTATGGAIITGGTAPGNTWVGNATYGHVWNAVAYGNGKFVVVGDATGFSDEYTLRTSSNGYDWSLSFTRKMGHNWKDVIYAQDKFVIVGEDNYGNAAVMTSPDTDTWTSGTPSSYMHGTGARIAYGNGTFAVTGRWLCQIGANYAPCGGVSTNGTDWSDRPMGPAVSSDVVATDLAFGNGTFHLIRSTSADKVMETCSPNGDGWLPCARSSTSGDFYSFDNAVNDVLAYGNGMFVTTSYTGAMSTSFDRLRDSDSTWVHFKPYITGVGGPIAFGNASFFMFYPGANSSKGVLIVGDTGWTEVNLPVSDTWTAIAYGANTFVAVGTGGHIIFSGVQ